MVEEKYTPFQPPINKVVNKVGENEYLSMLRSLLYRDIRVSICDFDFIRIIYT